MTNPEICCREWLAPRADVPTSVPVRHVCVKAWEHRFDDVLELCVCSCGAVRTPDEVNEHNHKENK